MHSESGSRAMRLIVVVMLLLFAGAAIAADEPKAWSPRQPAALIPAN